MKFFERRPKPQSNIDAENRLKSTLQANDVAERNLNYAVARHDELTPLIVQEARLEAQLELEQVLLQRAEVGARREKAQQNHEAEIYAIQVRMARLQNTPEPNPPSAQSENTPAQLALAQQQESHDAIKKELDDVRLKIQQGNNQLRQNFGA